MFFYNFMGKTDKDFLHIVLYICAKKLVNIKVRKMSFRKNFDPLCCVLVGPSSHKISDEKLIYSIVVVVCLKSILDPRT